MWPFSRQIRLSDSLIFKDFTDWHSHILPGVDDGVKSMSEALEILQLYEGMGVASLWLTPHIMEDMPNTPERLRERFAELQSAYKGRLKLHLAAENMLDNLFEERLDADELLPIGENGDHLLVETSYFSPPLGLEELLIRIKNKGYFPVLAHPERYAYMSEKDYLRLKSLDVKFQLNLGSLAGMYGSEARARALHLLKNSRYEIAGTDLHHRSLLRQSICRSDERAVRKLERNYSNSNK